MVRGLDSRRRMPHLKFDANPKNIIAVNIAEIIAALLVRVVISVYYLCTCFFIILPLILPYDIKNGTDHTVW